ncbi:MAG: hypothetical protein RSB51_06165 [Clostridia bacterium]
MRFKKILPLILVIAILTVLTVGIGIYYTNSRDIIKYENKKDVETDLDKAKKSSPIILSNLVLGAKYNNTWIDAKTFFANNAKENVDISTFTERGKMGTFQIKSYICGKNSEIYAKTSILNNQDVYIAVEGDKDITNRQMESVDVKKDLEENKKIVKKALFRFALRNKTVDIKKVYNVSIRPETVGKIIVANSAKSAKDKGAYSSVIYVEEGKAPEVIKMSYIRSIKKYSATWPIYDVKFVCDLNDDNTYEVVIEEITEKYASYSVNEKKGDKFYQVLKEKIVLPN